MTTILGLDLGRSSVKVTGKGGSILFPSLAALVGAHSDVSGKKRPLIVKTDGVELFVGQGAQEAGQPLENFSMDALTMATVEMKAILFGALTKFQRKFGDFDDAVEVVVGLPYQLLDGEQKQTDTWNRSIKAWIGGGHTWEADGKEMNAAITRVGLVSQAFGVQIDYVFDMHGQPVSDEHAQVMKMENGAISFGSNTVETQVTWRGDDTRRFCGGKAVGVSWLKTLSDPTGKFYFGEWSERLVNGELPQKFSVEPFIGAWWTEVDRFLTEKWHDDHERFNRVFVVGGGTYLLKDYLVRKFNGRAVFFSDPILPISRGLYKTALRDAMKRSVV